ncbi:MAG: phage virion morphogenesis protein [Mariprofundaceae bacterium]|nr:phage virion morphogenesis protein [Mariprofundaceae bacterium]
MSISITINDTDVRKAFAGMSALVNNQRKMMADVGDGMVSRVSRGFDKATSPYGVKWKPLSKAAKLGRLRNNKSNFKKSGRLSKRGRGSVKSGFQPLSSTGALKRSITRKAYKNSVEIGTDSDYAATHQFGRKITSKMFKGATIPARPFLPSNGLPKAWKDEMLDTMKEHMKKAMHG